MVIIKAFRFNRILGLLPIRSLSWYIKSRSALVLPHCTEQTLSRNLGSGD
jgi:hypothetical protein